MDWIDAPKGFKRGEWVRYIGRRDNGLIYGWMYQIAADSASGAAIHNNVRGSLHWMPDTWVERVPAPTARAEGAADEPFDDAFIARVVALNVQQEIIIDALTDKIAALNDDIEQLRGEAAALGKTGVS